MQILLRGYSRDGCQSACPEPIEGSVVTLFNSDGVPLRATVSLSLREYKTLEEQLQALNLQSADHTRVHVVRQGETLPQIAYSAYQDPRRWRLIADHNRLLNVRHLTPGAVLELPPTTT